MAWIYEEPYARRANGMINRQRHIDHFLTKSGNNWSCKVLRSALIKNVYYAAVETVKGRHRFVLGVVAETKLSKDREQIGFNIVQEWEGPNHCRCPVEILDMLTDANSMAAMRWRDKCLDYYFAHDGKEEITADI